MGRRQVVHIVRVAVSRILTTPLLESEREREKERKREREIERKRNRERERPRERERERERERATQNSVAKYDCHIERRHRA